MGLARSGDLANQIELGALLLIPIGILTYEVVNELPNDDRTRATAAWLLFLIGFPLSLYLHPEPSGTAGNGNLLFDSILLGGPLIVELALRRRGLEGEGHDRWLNHTDWCASDCILRYHGWIACHSVVCIGTTSRIQSSPRTCNRFVGLRLDCLGLDASIGKWRIEINS